VGQDPLEERVDERKISSKERKRAGGNLLRRFASAWKRFKDGKKEKAGERGDGSYGKKGRTFHVCCGTITE